MEWNGDGGYRPPHRAAIAVFCSGRHIVADCATDLQVIGAHHQLACIQDLLGRPASSHLFCHGALLPLVPILRVTERFPLQDICCWFGRSLGRSVGAPLVLECVCGEPADHVDELCKGGGVTGCGLRKMGVTHRTFPLLSRDHHCEIHWKLAHS